MNKVILVGRLTKDPEMRITQNGTNVCSFCVACDRRYSQNGERQADFIHCVAWRQCAEFISKYFKKGNRIALDGSMQTRSWEDDSGVKHYATEVIVEHAEFCERKQEQTPPNSIPATVPESMSSFDSFDFNEDDDFPF